MKTLASFRWGSHPRILLRTYKTLVRSIFDFSAGIYDPGSGDRWAQLERIQSAALRTAMGACSSAPIAALQAEAGIPPVSVRLYNLASRSILPGRPDNRIIRELLELNDNFRLSRHPFLLRTLRRLPVTLDEVETHPLATKYRSPYRPDRSPLHVDLDFPPAELTAADHPDTRSQLFHLLRATIRKDYDLLATDASKLPTGRVGAAFVDPQRAFSGIFKLPNAASVFVAELTAILQALKYTETLPTRKWLIISDSKSSLQAIKASRADVAEVQESLGGFGRLTAGPLDEAGVGTRPPGNPPECPGGSDGEHCRRDW